MRGGAFIVLLLLYCDVSGIRIRIKRRCSYDSDCELNSYCYRQEECHCKEGYSLFSNPQTLDEYCLRGQLTIGEECAFDEQCQVKMGLAAECSKVKDCQCRQGAHYLESNGRCYNTSKIGEHCLTSDYCHIKQPDVLLTCERGTCVCPRGHHGNRVGTRCIASVRLGDSCTATEQCVVDNSICYEVCRCDVHHIEDTNNTRCLQEAERVGDPCEESVQCSKSLSHSGCVRGLCHCLEYYHPGTQGYKCWKTARIGEPCSNEKECIPTPQWDPTVNLDLAICSNGLCKCAAGTTVDQYGSCIDNIADILTPTSMVIFLSTMVLATSNLQLC